MPHTPCTCTSGGLGEKALLLSLQGLVNSLSTEEAGGTDGAVLYMVGGGTTQLHTNAVH